jgi:hypothetical protein
MTTPDHATSSSAVTPSPGAAPAGDAGSTPTAAPFGEPQPQPLAPVPPRNATRRRSQGAGNALLMVAVLIAAGGIAFAVGRSTAPTSTGGDLAGGFAGGPSSAPNASFVPGDGAQGGPGGIGGSMTLTGTVTSVDGSTLTIETGDGQTVTVDTSGASYHAQAAASASDVTTGATIDVAVTGFGPGARPGASSAPDATAGTGNGLTASDVTIVSP